jgi:hypothetical protein
MKANLKPSTILDPADATDTVEESRRLHPVT